MAAPKGHPKYGGRQKGTANKATQGFKEAVTKFLDNYQDKFIEWLEQVEDPVDRFRIVKDLAEFAYPKLQRTDVTSGDEPLKAPQVVVYLPENNLIKKQKSPE